MSRERRTTERRTTGPANTHEMRPQARQDAAVACVSKKSFVVLEFISLVYFLSRRPPAVYRLSSRPALGLQTAHNSVMVARTGSGEGCSSGHAGKAACPMNQAEPASSKFRNRSFVAFVVNGSLLIGF